MAFLPHLSESYLDGMDGMYNWRLILAGCFLPLLLLLPRGI